MFEVITKGEGESTEFDTLEEALEWAQWLLESDPPPTVIIKPA